MKASDWVEPLVRTGDLPFRRCSKCGVKRPVPQLVTDIPARLVHCVREDHCAALLKTTPKVQEQQL